MDKRMADAYWLAHPQELADAQKEFPGALDAFAAIRRATGTPTEWTSRPTITSASFGPAQVMQPPLSLWNWMISWTGSIVVGSTMLATSAFFLGWLYTYLNMLLCPDHWAIKTDWNAVYWHQDLFFAIIILIVQFVFWFISTSAMFIYITGYWLTAPLLRWLRRARNDAITGGRIFSNNRIDEMRWKQNQIQNSHRYNVCRQGWNRAVRTIEDAFGPAVVILLIVLLAFGVHRAHMEPEVEQDSRPNTYFGANYERRARLRPRDLQAYSYDEPSTKIIVSRVTFTDCTKIVNWETPEATTITVTSIKTQWSNVRVEEPVVTVRLTTYLEPHVTRIIVPESKPRKKETITETITQT